MTDAYVFGYGSLVNRATHDHADATPATLSGWHRAWRHTALRPVAFLTVVPDAEAEIDGLVAHVPAAAWPALNDREHAYDRVRADRVAHRLSNPATVHVYTIPHGKHGLPDATHPVLLSYIDVVVQGFLREFGEDGVARFFETTTGWDAPIATDRHAPVYSRHQALTRKERALVDRHLDALACQLTEPPKLPR